MDHNSGLEIGRDDQIMVTISIKSFCQWALFTFFEIFKGLVACAPACPGAPITEVTNNALR